MQKPIIVLTILFVCVASREWILKDLRIPRVRPAVAQVDNKIYIAGGEISGGVETDSIEVLNTDRFEFEDVNINLPSPRQRFTAVPFGSKILFTGGAQNNIDVYDTSSNSWTVLTIPDLANVNVTFAGTLDNQLVLATSGGEALFIDPNSGKVITSVTYGAGSAVPPTRTFLQAPNYNGRIYVFNGTTIIGLDSTSSQPLQSRSESNAVVNHMFVLDGYLYLSDIAAYQFYFYLLNGSRWDARLLLGRRTDYSVAAVGSTVYVLGGALAYPNNTRTDYTTGFTFDTRYSVLSNPPIDLKVPRSQMTPFNAPNAALFIGGLTDANEYSSTIDIIYDGELKPPTAATPSMSNNPHATTSGSTQLLVNLVILIATVSVCLFN